jgi:CelD/BcsL family acetyltransferase involved in cellulose biosynthesis
MAITMSAPPPAAALRVVELGAGDDGRWLEFAAARGDALIYHHPAWLRALERESGMSALRLGCLDAAGSLRGVLPLMWTRGVPARGGQLGARRLASLPRTPVAGPLAEDAEVARALLAAAAERAAEAGALLQIKAPAPGLAALPAGMAGAPWRESYVLDLPARPEELHFGDARNHARILWAVRHARRLGVEVRPAESAAELRAWYPLYLETMRWHMQPARPLRFFEGCWELLAPAGLMELLLAEQREAGRTRLLAGSIVLRYGRTACYAFNGSSRAELALRPNDCLQLRAIGDACAAGCRRYDLGEVAGHQEGLAEFKRKWGARPEQLYRYYAPAPRTFESGDAPSGTAHSLALAAWRRVPLALTARAGELVSRWL